MKTTNIEKAIAAVNEIKNNPRVCKMSLKFISQPGSIYSHEFIHPYNIYKFMLQGDDKKYFDWDIEHLLEKLEDCKNGRFDQLVYLNIR